MKIDAKDEDLLNSRAGERNLPVAARHERATLAQGHVPQDRRLRLSSKDLEAIQKRAGLEGLPYADH